MSRPEHVALVAAARWGLPVTSSTVRLADEDLAAVRGVVGMDRLGGLLFHAMADGTVECSDHAREAIHSIWNAQLLASVVVEAQAVRAAAVLDGAGVRWRLTKGSAVAHLDYPDPGLRPFGDVDIVVHENDWGLALDACAGEGWRRPQPGLGLAYERRYGKGATFKTTEGLELDAHLRFAVGRFGVRSAMRDLFTHHGTVSLAGRSLPTLDPVGRLLHACHHATLGGFRRFRAHRDVAQLLLVTGASWESALAIAQRWRVEAVLARAIVESWHRLDLQDPHPAWVWAISHRIRRADRRALAVFGEERPFREQALTTVMALPAHEVPEFLAAVYSRDAAARLLANWRSRLRRSVTRAWR